MGGSLRRCYLRAWRKQQKTQKCQTLRLGRPPEALERGPGGGNRKCGIGTVHTYHHIVVSGMPFFLKVNRGRSKRGDIRVKSGSRGIRFELVGQSRLSNFPAQIAKPHVAHATINQAVLASITICRPHKLIGRRGDDCVKDSIIGCRDCASNINLTWTS